MLEPFPWIGKKKQQENAFPAGPSTARMFTVLRGGLFRSKTQAILFYSCQLKKDHSEILGL